MQRVVQGVNAVSKMRWVRYVAIAAIAVPILLLLALAFFPWGTLRSAAERRLSERFGAAVHIAGLERLDIVSLHPTVRITGLSIAQPNWAGHGSLMTLSTADVRFAALPMLFGRFSPDALDIDGARLALVRDAGGRTNWSADSSGSGSGLGGIDSFTVDHSVLSYRDAKQDRAFVAQVAAGASGISLDGRGSVRGAPVRIAVRAPSVRYPGRWPFRARIAGDALTMAVDGAMERPLDTGHMTIGVSARAADLKYVDSVIAAGLIGTQPVDLKARAEHDGTTWRVTGLRGTIGRSRLTAGHVTIARDDERRTVAGALDFATLDFSDFASDKGQRIAAARRKRLGPRILPATRIDLSGLDDIDGTLDARVRKLLGAAPFTAMSGTLSLDRSRLRVTPLVARLTRGTLSGPVTVDQRGRDTPTLAIDLTLKDSSIATFGGAGDFDAPLRGWARLTGSGETIRAALGGSDGVVALVSAKGVLPAKLASFIGLDVGRGVTTDADRKAVLRCLGMRMTVAGGKGSFDPLLIDTSRSQTRAVGGIDLSNERIRAALYGAPKENSILRIKKPIPVTGTIREPEPHAPKDAKSIGSILGMLGDAITGNQKPLASDADCGALTTQVLRR